MSSRILIWSFLFLITLAGVVTSSIESAPIPKSTQKTEIDQESIESYQKQGAQFGYFSRPEIRGTVYFQSAQDGAANSGIPGFKWIARPEQGFDKLPQIDLPFGMDLSDLVVSDSVIQELQLQKNLTILSLSNSRVNREVIVEVAKLNKLEFLNLMSNPISDEELKLLRPLKHLTCLQLDRTEITDAALKDLADFKDLKLLSMVGTHVTESGLRDLRNLKNLRTLCINHEKISDAFLKDMNRADTLQSLEIFTTLDGRRPKSREDVERANLDCPITDEGLKEIVAFKNIKSLSLNSPRVTEAGLKEVGHLEKLTELNLLGSSCIGSGFKELDRCKNLDTLFVDPSRLSVRMLRELKKAGLLHTLFQFKGEGGLRPKCPEDVRLGEFIDTGISEAGLGEFGDFKRMHTLLIDWNLVTPAVLKSLNSIGLLHTLQFASDSKGGRASSKDEVSVVNLQGMFMMKSDLLRELAAFKNLNSLSFQCETLDDGIVFELTKFANLKVLEVQCDNISMKAAFRLAEICAKSIRLVMHKLNDSIFSTLVKSKLVLQVHGLALKKGEPTGAIEEVDSLDLSNSEVTDLSIKELAAFKGLQSLDLDGTKVEGREFKCLRKLEKLTNLSLKQSAVTDEGVKQVMQFQTLKELNLNFTQITWKQANELEKALPDCRIVRTTIQKTNEQ